MADGEGAAKDYGVDVEAGIDEARLADASAKAHERFGELASRDDLYRYTRRAMGNFDAILRKAESSKAAILSSRFSIPLGDAESFLNVMFAEIRAEFKEVGAKFKRNGKMGAHEDGDDGDDGEE